jgi:aryl-alcohol dehydrogenase-like predicted oxidoreductase
MRTVALAGTRLSSSRLGFGLSGLHRVLRRRDRLALLAAAHETGITYFDTAPYYGHGLAENELGRFADGRRSQLLIATKFGIQPDPWLSRFPALMYARLAANASLRRVTRHEALAIRMRRDYTGSNAVKSLERSLRALRTDHVDILYLHEPTLALLGNAERLLDSLEGLQASGKVRCFGLSGGARDCLDIVRRYPHLGALMQVDAAQGAGDLKLLHESALAVHSSFGHFRGKRAPMIDLLAAAVGMNPHGVILFSTRSPQRIRAMAEALTTVETT